MIKSIKNLEGREFISAVGIILGILVFLVHSFSQSTERMGLFDSTFLIIGVVALGYFLVALRYSKTRFVVSIALSIFYISCFSLNREVNIFNKFPVWLSIYMVLTQLAMISQSLIPLIPKWLKKMIWFLAGAGLLLTFYLMIYLLPGFIIGAIGILAFGIGLHIFIPIISFIHFTKLIADEKQSFNDHKPWFIAGIALPVLMLSIYVGSYANFNARIQNVKQEYDKEMPQYPFTYFVQQYFKPKALDVFFMENQADARFNNFMVQADGEFHQPQQLIAELIFGTLPISESDQRGLIDNWYQHRHENNPRLWSGQNLSTDTVHTEVDIFPEYQMAYVQKTIWVRNNHQDVTNQQEAIYTFHLPQGAVGTSLSLWINGQEEPARLSTKSKVRNAYKTIVGRERRDPAMMQWEDGNRLVVNVFPVSPNLPRKFKVGFSIPITSSGQFSHINNVYFQGPDYNQGLEICQVHFQGNYDLAQVRAYNGLKLQDKIFQSSGAVQGAWSLKWIQPALSSKAFAFNGKSYRVFPLKNDFETKQLNSLILDVNQEWSKIDFEKIWESRGQAKVYITTNKSTVLLTDENAFAQFAKYRERAFSILPFFSIFNNQIPAENTLVVTKSVKNMPYFSDLENSNYHRNLVILQQNSNQKFALYDLASTSSAFCQAFDECGLANLQNGSIAELSNMLSTQQIQVLKEKHQRVYLPNAQIGIEQIDTALEVGNRADHLMRLYHFNKCFEELKPMYFNRDSVPENAIEHAITANIVTPHSSLVSLETVDDYQRFEIKKQATTGLHKSLGNSGILGDGAVPEPHEWALIMLGVLVLSIMIYKRFVG